MFRFLFLAIVSTAAAFRFPINTDSAQIAGRRTAVAAIGSAFAAAPLAASAAFVNLQSKVAQEEQALKTEQTLIKDIDEKMKKESRKAFADELEIKKKEDLQLLAMKKNDWAEAKRLEVEIVELKNDEKKLDKELVAMREAELKEVMYEKQIQKNLAVDKKALVAEENAIALRESERLTADCSLTDDDFAALPSKEQEKLVADGYNAKDRAALCGAA